MSDPASRQLDIFARGNVRTFVNRNHQIIEIVGSRNASMIGSTRAILFARSMCSWMRGAGAAHDRVCARC
jgi:predicted Rossmann fold nucleotide-binding protein DprA/Smf involved in DNA uptake